MEWKNIAIRLIKINKNCGKEQAKEEEEKIPYQAKTTFVSKIISTLNHNPNEIRVITLCVCFKSNHITT